MNPIISKETMAGLLGRALEQVEVDNYDLYLDIAKARIEDLLCDTLTSDMPVDLQLLVARCFGILLTEQRAMGNYGVTTKKVEDFSISFDNENADNSPMVAFVRQNASILDKYGKCQSPFRSGRTYDCIRYI